MRNYLHYNLYDQVGLLFFYVSACILFFFCYCLVFLLIFGGLVGFVLLVGNQYCVITEESQICCSFAIPVPWNPEVFLLTNECEAKRRNARENLWVYALGPLNMPIQSEAIIEVSESDFEGPYIQRT